MKIKDLYNVKENKIILKRWFIIMAYVGMVFNIIFFKYLWSIPFAVTLYFVYAVISFGRQNKNKTEITMFVLYAVSALIFVVSIVFDFMMDIMPFISYGLLFAEAFIYNRKYNSEKGKRESTSLYCMLVKTTAIAAFSSFIYIVKYQSGIFGMIVCIITSFIMMFLSGAGIKDEIFFSLRKYFNVGVDVMDEY